VLFLPSCSDKDSSAWQTHTLYCEIYNIFPGSPFDNKIVATIDAFQYEKIDGRYKRVESTRLKCEKRSIWSEFKLWSKWIIVCNDKSQIISAKRWQIKDSEINKEIRNPFLEGMKEFLEKEK